MRIGDLPPALVSRMEGYRPPDDFDSDGATGAFDILLPFDARPAAIHHDWAYVIGKTRADRAEADRMLYRNLRECRVGPVRSFCWWVAVRLFGWRHFQHANPLDRRREMLVSAFWLFVLVASAVSASWWLGR